jgi:site-specific DNA-methyltransferase (adenine-specific)
MIELHHGDCTEIMPRLDADIADTIITDPPYGLSFMGKEWDDFNDNQAFQEWTRRWAFEALRVAKPGAFLLCFGGTRTFHRVACGIEDAGWEIRDTIGWIYGSGFPKSHNISKAIDRQAGAEREVVGEYQAPDGANREPRKTSHFGSDANPNNYDITAPATPEAQKWDGWGTALKPAWEPIIVAMKPIPTTFAENALEHGVSGLWIDGGRVETDESITINTWDDGAKPFGGGAGNKYSGRKEMSGRWPANIIHDGSDEVMAVFPENGKDTSARFFYCAKASKAERNKGLEGMEARQVARMGHGNSEQDGLTQCFITTMQNTHPTVKPLGLMKYLCKLTRTPDGGIVLDPFMGSGTTGIACKALGRAFIGIELDEHYFEIAKKRIEAPVQKELL